MTDTRIQAVPVGAEELDDKILADRARHGVSEAFDLLVGRYQGRVYRLAARMSGSASEAEEVTQETFLRAHRGLSSFRSESRFGTWLHRIAVNEVLMRRRAARRRPTCSLDAWGASGHADGSRASDASAPDPGPLADDLLYRKRRAERLHDALNELDEDARVALVYRDLEEMSVEEAAGRLGISVGALRQRARRARLRLRKLLVA